MEKTRTLETQEGPAPGTMSTAHATQILSETLLVITVFCEPVNQSSAWTSLEAALAQGGMSAELFIYDNSPAAQGAPCSPFITSHYHHDASNPGVSAAYNAAYRFALNAGKKWLMLFDQDTQLSTGSIFQYAAAVDENPSCSIFAPRVEDRIGVISPFRFSRGRGIRINNPSARFLPLATWRAINSGLLISCNLFGKVGGYEESVAVDFSDIAFLEKAKMICDSLCLVETTLHQDFSGSVIISRETDLARYGRFSAGALAFARRFGRNELRWISLFRAVKLSLRWRHLGFVRIHVDTWT